MNRKFLITSAFACTFVAAVPSSAPDMRPAFAALFERG
jgi:hypothetical protein